jgi:hypothetical protein
MSSWSAKLFFFLVVGFVIFTVSGGYGSVWKQIFTNSNLANSSTGSASAANQLSSNLQQSQTLLNNSLAQAAEVL